MIKLLLIVFIVLYCSFIFAINPLPEQLSSEQEEQQEEESIPEMEFELKEEPPPLEIQESIELQKQMKEEVVQRKNEEALETKILKDKKRVHKKVIPEQEVIPKGPSKYVIMTALVILLVAFLIYPRK